MQAYTIKKLALLGLGLMSMATPAVTAMAGDVYVIAHPGVMLSEMDLKDAYLGEKQFAGSVKLVLVDNAAAQSDFLAKTLGIEAKKYAALWIKKGFRGGLAAPLSKSSDTEVANFVKSTPGAVGYVGAPVPGVKQLFKY